MQLNPLQASKSYEIIPLSDILNKCRAIFVLTRIEDKCSRNLLVNLYTTFSLSTVQYIHVIQSTHLFSLGNTYSPTVLPSVNYDTCTVLHVHIHYSMRERV